MKTEVREKCISFLYVLQEIIHLTKTLIKHCNAIKIEYNVNFQTIYGIKHGSIPYKPNCNK